MYKVYQVIENEEGNWETGEMNFKEFGNLRKAVEYAEAIHANGPLYLLKRGCTLVTSVLEGNNEILAYSAK